MIPLKIYRPVYFIDIVVVNCESVKIELETGPQRD